MKVIHLFRTGGTGYGLERNILCTLPGLVEEGIDAKCVAIDEELLFHDYWIASCEPAPTEVPA